MRAAPIVTLVLSFAVVLGLGWAIGPPAPVPAATSSPAPPPPETATEGPLPPLDPPFTPAPSREVPSPPVSIGSGAPVSIGSGAPASTGSGAIATALEPDETGQVHMGRVTADSRYPGSSLFPTVIETKDENLQVCVRIAPNQVIVDDTGRTWGQQQPPNGDRYCTYIAPGAPVTFRLGTR